jgi:hypothetical protein
MKTVFLLFTMQLFKIVCIGCACYMALNHITGWGWFIAAAILGSSSYSSSCSTNKNETNE